MFSSLKPETHKTDVGFVLLFNFSSEKKEKVTIDNLTRHFKKEKMCTGTYT